MTMSCIEKYRQLMFEAFLAYVDALDGTVEHIRYEGNTATVTLKGE